MATNAPITLYFISPIYARGEHLIGEKAVDDDGHPNMVLVKRGEKRRVPFEQAKDLIIAKQAVDWINGRQSDKDEAEAFVAARLEEEAKAAKKAAQEAANEIDLRASYNALRKEFEALKKKVA